MRGAMFVYDERGYVFAALRRAGLGVTLWRARLEDADASDARLAVVAGPMADPRLVSTLASRAPTVVVSTDPTDAEALTALHAGALGYIEATGQNGSLRRALLAAMRGEVVYARRVLLAGIRSALGDRSPRALSPLTPRQHEVLALISQGATDKQIGVTLGIAHTTAQRHAANLMRRLGVPNRAAAAARAARAS
jgi:DNA-binding NarL/FixJ family response regulator